MTSVTDVDRKAAASMLDPAIAEGTQQMLREGKLDHHSWVQAFARHRIAARNAALEEAAQMAEWSHMVPPDGGSPSADECRVAFEAAHSIRALMTKENLHEM